MNGRSHAPSSHVGQSGAGEINNERGTYPNEGLTIRRRDIADERLGRRLRRN